MPATNKRMTKSMFNIMCSISFLFFIVCGKILETINIQLFLFYGSII